MGKTAKVAINEIVRNGQNHQGGQNDLNLEWPCSPESPKGRIVPNCKTAKMAEKANLFKLDSVISLKSVKGPDCQIWPKTLTCQQDQKGQFGKIGQKGKIGKIDQNGKSDQIDNNFQNIQKGQTDQSLQFGRKCHNGSNGQTVRIYQKCLIGIYGQTG